MLEVVFSDSEKGSMKANRHTQMTYILSSKATSWR